MGAADTGGAGPGEGAGAGTEAASGKVVFVTADRRVASMGVFGGDDEDHLRESFDDVARDLAKFLAHLLRGEAPRAE